jgi:hypothetical protein
MAKQMKPCPIPADLVYLLGLPPPRKRSFKQQWLEQLTVCPQKPKREDLQTALAISQQNMHRRRKIQNIILDDMKLKTTKSKHCTISLLYWRAR